ncbi:hypothetical protein [Haloarcula sp. JP-L23]|uniref:hypothetical protein n=1 Tax=Haloarcula sp. JP-L23 TaxID=2716717 RepID=UPI00140F43C5|nr:hypothetical protein G9465_03555 [Haloarcula sp. JP-L23]
MATRVIVFIVGCARVARTPLRRGSGISVSEPERPTRSWLLERAGWENGATGCLNRAAP